jgi:hypothetical protein
MLLVPLPGPSSASPRPTLQGLDWSLVNPFADGAQLAWVRGRTVYYGDLITGRSWRLAGAKAPDRVSGFAVGPGGRTALVETDRELIMITRLHGRTVRRTANTTGGFAISADGRFAWYQDDAGSVVRSFISRGSTQLPTDSASWSPIGHRLAYHDNGTLDILDAHSGQTVQVPLPPAAQVPDGASWSPDARFVVAAGIAYDVATGGTAPLPPLPDAVYAWRPGHGHQLLRWANDAIGVTTDLLDASTAKRLWVRELGAGTEWSPTGRLLLSRGEERILSGASGQTVHLPSALRRLLAKANGEGWLAGDVLQVSSDPVLRIAQPPSWAPRVLARARAGHHMAADELVRATPAGVRLLARTFAPRATPRDCR